MKHAHIFDHIKPCIICRTNSNLHEYMVDATRSYIRCDTCGVTGECGDTAFQSRDNWNKLMEDMPFLIEI